MSRRAADWAWKTPAGGTDLLVLLALANWADESGLCWPKVESVSEMTGLSRRAVQAALSSLEVMGVLKIERGSGRANPSRYLLQVDRDHFNVLKGRTTRTLSSKVAPSQEAQDVHPSEGSKGADDAPLKGADPALFETERVQNLQEKGADPAPPIGHGHRHKNPPNPPRGKRRASKKPVVREDPDFIRFWEVYENKVGIAAAERKWLEAIARPGVTPALLIERASTYKARLKAEGRWPKFSANPATWLNQERYLDEPALHPTASRPADITDPEEYLRDLWRKADVMPVARLAGVAWVEPPQPPSDHTPRTEWLRKARQDFIVKHREAALAALSHRRSA